jgi:hypothetical protein
MAQLTNRSPLGFKAQTKIPSRWFCGLNHQIAAAGFEALTGKPSTTCFEAKPGETITTSFEAKSGETVPVVLRPNHWQIVPVVLRSNYWQTADLGFESQPRNPRSSSPCSWYRPHTMLPDLSIVRPLSIQPVRPTPVLCTRSHTSIMILIATCHAAPTTYTPRDKKTRFSK